MKKINELLAERAQIVSAMEVITATETMTEELRSAFTENDAKVIAIDNEIAMLKRAEELNKNQAKSTMENTIETPKTVGQEFREFLNSAVNENGKRSFEYRADPILTTTNTDVINKTVANSVDIMLSPGQAFLNTLGVTMYPGLVGNFVVPSMAEDLATFPGEDASAASAGMAPESLVLAARRLTHTQAITKETLAQTNPAIYAGIVQNLIDGIWNAIVKDSFTQLATDAATQISATGTSLTYTDMLNCEASIGGLGMGAGAYVTTPTGRAYLKSKIAIGTGAGPAIWNANEINGYKALSTATGQLAANRVVFGDFGKLAVGQWGGIEIVVDPYTKAAQGEIVLTAVTLADTGVTNKRGFAVRDGSFA